MGEFPFVSSGGKGGEPPFVLGGSVGSNVDVAIGRWALEYSALVSGQTGSGKTKGVVERLIFSLFQNPTRPGALIINIKDQLDVLVEKLGRESGQENRVVVLRPGGTAKMNLIAPFMNPQKLAEALMYSCTSPGEARHPINGYWIQNAIRVLDLAITLARATCPAEMVTMDDVARLCTEFGAVQNSATGNPTVGEQTKTLLQIFEEKLLQLPPDHPDSRRLFRELRMMRDEINRLVALDERPRTSICGELERIIYACRPHEIADVFCAAGDEATFGGIPELVEKGKIVVLDFPPQRHGLAGKLICSMLKRELFCYLLQTRGSAAKVTDKPVYFLCDEAQFFLQLDDGPESDANFSAVARSLRCRMWFCTQEANSFSAAVGPESQAIVRNFLRNLRVHIHLRQNYSQEFAELLEERGVAWNVGLQFPTLPKFVAMLIVDGSGQRMVRLRPLTIQPDVEEQERKKTLLESRSTILFRHAAMLDSSSTSENRSNKMLVATASDVSAQLLLDALESQLKDAGVPVIRFSADRIATEDVGVIIAKASRSDMNFRDVGVILVDRLDRLAENLAGMTGLRTLVESGKIDMGISEFRIDLSVLQIVASYVTEKEATIGFVSRNQTEPQMRVPTLFRRQFRVLVDSENLTDETCDRRTARETH